MDDDVLEEIELKDNAINDKRPAFMNFTIKKEVDLENELRNIKSTPRPKG